MAGYVAGARWRTEGVLERVITYKAVAFLFPTYTIFLPIIRGRVGRVLSFRSLIAGWRGLMNTKLIVKAKNNNKVASRYSGQALCRDEICIRPQLSALTMPLRPLPRSAALLITSDAIKRNDQRPTSTLWLFGGDAGSREIKNSHFSDRPPPRRDHTLWCYYCD